MVVAYKTSRLTYAIAMKLIRTKYVVLFNIAAQAFVAPEMIQDDCNGPALAREVAARLDDPALRVRQVAQQNAALEKMGRGGPDPSEAAAEVVHKMLAESGALKQ
jgi:lipid-A-disaccharide synthase